MKIIGHRGARGLASENTLKGLEEAISHDVDEIEFDVRVTKDKIPVLHHDSEVTDSRGRKFSISKNTLLSLRKHKPDLTTLKDVFERVNQKMPLYIEIKPDVSVQPIIKVLKAQIDKGRPAENMRIASFSQKVLIEIHRALPELPKIVNESWSGIRARKRADALDTNLLSMSQRRLWRGIVKSMHKRGYELYTYTINKPRKAIKLQRHGLAGVVTDFPDRFKHKP
jgi:glycerophosphoryl diester phosphodiesterase